MPPEKPPCPYCNYTDASVISFNLISVSVCNSCGHCWNSGPIDEHPITPGDLSAGDGDGTPSLNESQSCPSLSEAPAISVLSACDGAWLSEPHPPTASFLSDPHQFTQTSPCDTQRFESLLQRISQAWRDEVAAAAAALGSYGGTIHRMGWERAHGESSSYHKQRDESPFLGISPVWWDAAAAAAALSPYGGTTHRMGWETAHGESSSYHKQRNESPFLVWLDEAVVAALSPYGGTTHRMGWETAHGESSSYHKQRDESPFLVWLDEAAAAATAAALSPYGGTIHRMGWERAHGEFSSYHKQRDESPFLGMTHGVSECITCKRQFCRRDFCDCHRKLTPIIDEFQLKSSPSKARPGSSFLLPNPIRSNLSGGGTSTMHNHGSSGEVIGFAHEHGNIEMEGMHSRGHTLRHLAPTPTPPNVSDESTSEPSRADLSASDSPPTVQSSRQLQLLSYSFNRDHGEPNRVLNVPSKDTDVEMRGMPSSDLVQGGPTLVLRGDSSSHGFADEDSDVEMRGMHSSDGVQGGPTLVLRGDSSSHGFADDDGDIEMGGTHSTDRVPSEARSVVPSSDHLAYEVPWQRLATMVDPLFGVNVQGAFSLVAYKSSDGSSPAKDVLLYLLVFLFVLGFSAALGGKFYRSSKMGVIGLGAAALGFLMTMALVVVHKI